MVAEVGEGDAFLGQTYGLGPLYYQVPAVEGYCFIAAGNRLFKRLSGRVSLYAPYARGSGLLHLRRSFLTHVPVMPYVHRDTIKPWAAQVINLIPEKFAGNVVDASHNRLKTYGTAKRMFTWN